MTTFYVKAFDEALLHAMLYEVGGHWKLTPAVEAGLCGTDAEKRATGYVNDPVDAGGETKFGIAKNANPTVDIKTLTWAGAKEIYYKKYWLASACDKLEPRLSALHFDGAINHGVKRAIIFLQTAIGTTADGVIGPVSIALIAKKVELDIINGICDLRVQFYNQIVQKTPSQSRFLKGWLRRISEMRVFVTSKEVKFE